MPIDLNDLVKSSSLKLLSELLEKESSLLIEGLWDSPKAAIAALCYKKCKKTVVIITGKERESRILDNLEYFGVADALDFPSWETLPGEEITPSPDIVGKRYETLYALLNTKGPHLLLCPLQAILQKTLLPSSLKPLCHLWKRGDTVSFMELPTLLTSLGYKRASVASDKGEFAVRGGIIDIFPLSAAEPYRLDFFGDTIDQIRTYDPVGQKSIGVVDKLFLSPALELDLLKNEKEIGSLFDYLSKDTLVIFDDLLEIEDRYISLQKMAGAKSRYLGNFADLFSRAKEAQVMFWTEERAEELSDVHLPKKVGRAYYTGKDPLQPLNFEMMHEKIETKRFMHPFVEILDFFSALDNKSALTQDEVLQAFPRFSALDLHMVFTKESEKAVFEEQSKDKEVVFPKKTTFEIGYLSNGFVVSDSHLCLLPLTEFTHRYKTRRQKWRGTYHTPASEFHELLTGDIVVHFHNGIGKYLGIEKKANHLGQVSEFMVIEYAEGSKLFVPMQQAHLVSRYIGSHEEVPHLSTLGSKRWQNMKEGAQKAIIGYAKDLLELQAAREVKGGFVFPDDGSDMELFESEFPYVETEDQLRAIADIKKDMTSSKAMDRLVCGDVGYGKTEVAMRAAFKAVLDGKKQVAVLVPTTVLAMQHFDSFVERMANFPVEIGVVSRFKTPKQVKETLKKAENGTLDILIGTHRLISKDVRFKDLGLLIIDEEQRFGVRAKEHLKAIKLGVDCITLSATPIPRTLYMSLIGTKDISVINTPPQDRLPIKTIIAEKDPSLVQNALLRELSRDGQAFFIHNRVESLPLVLSELQKLLPQARIVTAHGQMSSDEVDFVFHSFKSGEADILIATTIVENGIDIPNANTILIDRSDQFGLADLYQLRGRVGRWNRPAYAYFLTPVKRELAEITRRRLHALLEASGYGGGMKIAMRDLEIRGAGDILGTQQSGQISAIGFHLYCKLLKRTIDAISKKITPSFTETKMEFPYNASLPELYINETSLRMEIYHRLGDATTFEEVDAILSELKDRFGPYPPEVIWLYHLTRLRIFASSHHFTLLKFEQYTFTAEQKKGKTSIKKVIALPRTKKPEDLEKSVIALLKEQFAL